MCRRPLPTSGKGYVVGKPRSFLICRDCWKGWVIKHSRPRKVLIRTVRFTLEQYEVEDAEVIKDSGKALLIEAPEFDEATWIPKSAITDDSEVWKANQEPGSLMLYMWFAEKRGWV